MKRKLSIILALVLAVSLLMVPAAVSADGEVGVTVQLTDSDGTLLSGGDVEYRGKGPGTDSRNKWSEFGTTGDEGTVIGNLSPGKYWFSVKYNDTYAKIKQDIVENPTVSFTTTSVTLGFSGDITYNSKVNPGMWVTYEGPMEMLPGTYAFRFREDESYPWASTKIEVSGDSVDKSIVILKLLDSGGNGLADGTFDYRIGYGPRTTIGTTDSSGLIVYVIDGLKTNVKFRVRYAGTTLETEQNIATNSYVVFQTVQVTAVLNDSSGSPITSGVSYKYRYSYAPYQAFTSPMELLPVNTKVKVYYAGTSVEKQQNVGTNPDFVFNTVSVTAVLNDSSGNPISSGVSYKYRYSYNPYQTFTSPMELLPVNTKVKVSYAGTSVEKQQSVGTNPNFVFQTGSVVSNSGTCTYYRYGFKPWRPFTSGMELLPVSTKFKFNDGTPEAVITVIAGTTNNIH